MMTDTPQPTLQSPRLLLRPLEWEDAPRIEELAGNPQVAATTLRIPHPYPPGLAERFIEEQEMLYHSGQGISFAIVEKSNGIICGCLGLGREEEHLRAELGYWLGPQFWGRGYATEAARLLLGYGFAVMRLQRVIAHQFVFNAASGRVLEKLGMKREGLLRRHFYKPGRGFEDAFIYGLLLEEWVKMGITGASVPNNHR